MSRLWTYTGSQNSITFDAGALAAQSRPFSVAFLIRPTTGSGNGEFGGIFEVRTSGGLYWALITDNAYFWLQSDGSGSSGEAQYAQTWTYVGLTIPASAAGQTRWHFWREDTGTWNHTDAGTISLSGTIDNIVVGVWNGAHYAGLIAAAGFWLAELSDADHEANGVTALQDWWDNSPDILWSFESAGTVNDLTDGGADQTATAGSTTESATEPPGWSYAISSGTAVPLGAASEVDDANAVTARKTATLGSPAEADQARPVTALHRAALGPAVERDQARPAVAVKRASLGVARETDSPLALTAVKRAPLGAASEQDTARAAILPSAPLQLDAAGTVDAARSMTVVLVRHLDPARTADSARALVVRKLSSLGAARERDRVLAVAGPPSGATTIPPPDIGTIARPDTGVITRPSAGTITVPTATWPP